MVFTSLSPFFETTSMALPHLPPVIFLSSLKTHFGQPNSPLSVTSFLSSFLSSSARATAPAKDSTRPASSVKNATFILNLPLVRSYAQSRRVAGPSLLCCPESEYSRDGQAWQSSSCRRANCCRGTP